MLKVRKATQLTSFQQVARNSIKATLLTFAQHVPDLDRFHTSIRT